MKNILIFMKFILYTLWNPPNRISQTINTIHTITYREFSPLGGKGGGSAVQSCQQILLGSDYKEKSLRYTYFEKNKYWENWDSRLADLWAGAFFAITKTKKESDAVYITHDYTTAFGLSLMRKRYVYVSHLQGPRVEEKLNYNEHFTKIDALIVKFCERRVFKKAMYVCFPSDGAKNYYFSSKQRSLELHEAKIGPTLYNTIYANPRPVPAPNMTENREILTFLSIGALTYAKGIDQIPLFLEKFLEIHKDSVRWIIVGNGPLMTPLKKDIDTITKRFNNLSIHIFKSCSYDMTRHLISISDIYIMFHRISIFDLATLESMKEGNCIVLSNAGGNPEFNKSENIILHDGNNAETAKKINRNNIDDLKKTNKLVYEKYFSNEKFITAYHQVMDDLLDIQ